MVIFSLLYDVGMFVLRKKNIEKINKQNKKNYLYGDRVESIHIFFFLFFNNVYAQHLTEPIDVCVAK